MPIGPLPWISSSIFLLSMMQSLNPLPSKRSRLVMTSHWNSLLCLGRFLMELNKMVYVAMAFTLQQKKTVNTPFIGMGKGTNTLAKAMALAGLLSFCPFLNLQDVSIFGDSKALVDYVSGKISISRPLLVGWLDRIRYSWISLTGGSAHHISRNQNLLADALLKKGLHVAMGCWHLQVYSGGKINPIQDFYPPEF